MIKVIFFDLGGVLISDLFSRIDSWVAKTSGLPIDEVVSVRKKHWAALRIGNTDCDAFWKGLLSELGSHLDVNTVVKESYRRMDVDTDAIRVVRGIKQSGKYRLGVISNNSHEWSEYAKNELGLGAYFDDWVSSSDIGIAKPDRSIFLLAAKRLGVKPEECIFVDDQQQHTEAASVVGMKGIQFMNVRQLESELRQLGVVF